MQISSSPDPFASFQTPSKPIQPSIEDDLSIDESSISSLDDNPPLGESSLISKKIVEIDKIIDVDDIIAEKDQEMDISHVVRVIGVKDNQLIVSSLIGEKLEEISQGLAEGRLGRIEQGKDGQATIKLSDKQLKELQPLAITSVEVRGPTGIQTYTSFNLRALSDRELNQLTIQVKTYIVFLKTIDPNNEKSIKKYELQIKYLELEKAIRANDQEKIEDLLEELIDTKFGKMILNMLFLLEQSIKDKTERELDKKFWDKKHIILLKEIFDTELKASIIKENIIKNENNSSSNINGVIFHQNKNRSLIDLGKFINMYNR